MLKLRRFLPQRKTPARSSELKHSAAAPLIAIDSGRQPQWMAKNVHAFAREGFAGNAVGYRCVRMIAEAAASVPWLLYEGEREHADHPLLQLLRRPNPAQDGQSFTETLFLMPGDSIALLYDAQASAWSELASQRLARNFDVFADAFALNELALLVSGNGAGAAQSDYLLTDAVQKPRGILRLGTGTSAAGHAHWGSGGTAIAAGQGACLYLARLAVETLSSSAERFRIIAGWHDGMETAQAANGVFWDYEESASPCWRLCSADGGITAATISNRLVGTDYVWLGIFLNAAWSRADFFSSADGRIWTFHDSLTVGPPAAVRALGFSASIAKSLGETARHLNVDLQAVRCDGLRGS